MHLQHLLVGSQAMVAWPNIGKTTNSTPSKLRLCPPRLPLSYSPTMEIMRKSCCLTCCHFLNSNEDKCIHRQVTFPQPLDCPLHSLSREIQNNPEDSETSYSYFSHMPLKMIVFLLLIPFITKVNTLLLPTKGFDDDSLMIPYYMLVQRSVKIIIN